MSPIPPMPPEIRLFFQIAILIFPALLPSAVLFFSCEWHQKDAFLEKHPSKKWILSILSWGSVFVFLGGAVLYYSEPSALRTFAALTICMILLGMIESFTAVTIFVYPKDNHNDQLVVYTFHPQVRVLGVIRIILGGISLFLTFSPYKVLIDALLN